MSTPTHPSGEAGGTATGTVIDIADEIDKAPISGLQIGVIIVASLAVVFDGFDSQLFGLSIPAIAAEYGIQPAALSAQLGWVLSLTFVGMGIGAVSGGYVADKLGRKLALNISLLVIGVTTVAAALMPNIPLLGVMRVLTGLGIGMVLPVVASLVAEYTPGRRRSFTVALSIVCVPLGGLLGGIVAAGLLDAIGWRGMWLLGGGLAILITVLIHFVVPESPQFLAARHAPGDRERVIATLRRMGHNIPDDAQFLNHHDHEKQRASVGALLKPEHRRDTLGIWLAFFGSLLGVYMIFGAAPTLLRQGFKFTSADASLSITWYNIGAIALTIIGSWAMGKWGSKPVLMTLAVGAAVSAAWLWLMPPVVGAGATGTFVAQFVIHGGFFAGLQSVLYSLCAQLYPVSIKGIGVGMAGTVGRIGAIVASVLGLALVTSGGTFFLVIALAAVACFVAMLIVKNHTPPAGRETKY
ncbi:MFS transporter [Granulicoccus phenolivorans]|uniref:MFS transporter n=1 Tax=Granulicoccus phenolivorans TaxID=266854 RepID=UPI0003F657E1|nr:MFS transporter [Granulicoccus phenolivorans]